MGKRKLCRLSEWVFHGWKLCDSQLYLRISQESMGPPNISFHFVNLVQRGRKMIKWICNNKIAPHWAFGCTCFELWLSVHRHHFIIIFSDFDSNMRKLNEKMVSLPITLDFLGILQINNGFIWENAVINPYLFDLTGFNWLVIVILNMRTV